MCLASLASIVAVVSAVPGLAAAQSMDFEARGAALRELASASGWVREDVMDASRVEERWCPPPGPCATDASAPGPDVLVITRWGVSRSIAHRRTAPSGWRVTVSLGWWEASPPTFDLRFERGPSVLHIGWELHSPELSDGTYLSPPADDVAGDFHGWLRHELLAYLESGASLRDRVVRRSESLRAHVHRHAASLSVCDDARDPGRFACVPMAGAGGMSGHAMIDTCVHRRLTEAEQAAFIAQADAELDARNAIARAHAAELHEALLGAFGPIAP